MTSFDCISFLGNLFFGLAMLVFGFAGGLFVAGLVWRKSMNQKSDTKCEPHWPSTN